MKITQPTRYSIDPVYEVDMDIDRDGRFVDYEDYQDLEKEIAVLKRALTHAIYDAMRELEPREKNFKEHYKMYITDAEKEFEE